MTAGWVASLVVVATLASVVTYAAVAVSPVRNESGARQIATLTPLPGWTTPQFFGDDSAVKGYGFHGILLISSDRGYFSYGEDCLAAVAEDAVDEDATSIAGPLYSDCAVGDFPATVKLVVDQEAPAQLRDEFSEDTGLQFVLDGDRVGVFISE